MLWTLFLLLSIGELNQTFSSIEAEREGGLNLKSSTMNSDAIGYWNQKKEKLKLKYRTITDEDLSYNDGKEKEMMEMLAYKLGKTKDELVNIIVTL